MAVPSLKILLGDALKQLRTLSDESVHCVVTSPPYWGLRDYQIDAQLGLERTPEEYVSKMVEVFREVKRVLRKDGTLWLNMGDSYASDFKGSGGPSEKQLSNAGSRYKMSQRLNHGLKSKDLVGIPWMVAFALRGDGWYLRSDIIWCLSGGTWLYAKTQKGETPMMLRDIARLNPTTVKLWNGEKWTQVLGWSRTSRNADELEIVLRSGERISCTPSHQFPTVIGLKKAGELVVGDVLKSVRLPEPENAYNPTSVPNEAAWFIGLYLAEGSRSGDTIQISGYASEIDRIEKLRGLAGFYGGSLTHNLTENGLNIRLYGRFINALVDQYVSGNDAKTKALKVRTWAHSNEWLGCLLQGYLAGDGHYDKENNRWRLGFARNYSLERDLRTMSARLGFTLTLNLSTAQSQSGIFPSFRGEIRFVQSDHHNVRSRTEIVEIRKARCREVYDIGVEDHPHWFALASGILTHNSKPNPMPESVTDRPTKAHEYVFLLTKQPRYFWDAEAIKEKTNGREVFGNSRLLNHTDRNDCDRQDMTENWSRNKRSVWTITTQPFSDWTETVRWRRVEAGARGDGTRRIVSPNSQADGGLFDLLATVLYDEHGEHSLNDIVCMCNRLSLTPRDGYVPSDQLRAYYFGDENLDSFLRRRLGFAIRRSNGTNKTALFVATSLACKPSVERSCRIGRILEIHGWSEQDRDMLLSNTWPDDWDARLWDRTLYHTGDNASCEGMYRKASEMSSHFATFPEELPKICILAGTSAKGCCTRCGSPWERIVEKEPNSGGILGGEHREVYRDGGFGHRGERDHEKEKRLGESKTLGWQPTCKCWNGNAGVFDTLPCTVLDPFAGSGTTGKVALELGRSAILIELNEAYVKLIEKRCQVTPGLALA